MRNTTYNWGRIIGKLEGGVLHLYTNQGQYITTIQSSKGGITSASWHGGTTITTWNDYGMAEHWEISGV